MLKPVYTKSFGKDIKRIQKRSKRMDKLKAIMVLLVHQKPLPAKNRDHALTGNFKNRRECHIEPDWLLIYKLDNDTIIFERTGSHSDLFK